MLFQSLAESNKFRSLGNLVSAKDYNRIIRIFARCARKNLIFCKPLASFENMRFEFPADRDFFEALLCGVGESLETYSYLFDFRPPTEKRREFNSIRATVFAELVNAFGERCMLNCSPDCDSNSGLVVDHLIPISSNKLNKELRSLGASRAEDGRLKKAGTQTFGSNNRRNLVLACHNCNSLKQNRFLDSEHVRRLLRLGEEAG